MRPLTILCIGLGLSTCTTPPPDPPSALTQAPEAIQPDPYISMDSSMALRYDIPVSLAHSISDAARHHSIPYFTAFSLVRVESNFYPLALSWAGAIGLTQVMPETGWLHCRLTPRGLRHSSLNLHCGFSYLSSMHARFGSWRIALAAYHRGPARTSRELAAGSGHGTSESYIRWVLGS